MPNLSCPPRCRKWRNVHVKRDHRTTFLRVSEREAPVALIMFKGVHEELPEHGSSTTTPYRLFDRRLFVPCNLHRFECTNEDRPATLDDLAPVNASWWGCETRESAQDQLDDWARRYLIVGDSVWEKIGEPRYVVMTFGMGNNYGGTAVMTDHSYNSNVRRDFYYRIDQREWAIRRGTQVAKMRGDTDSLPMKPHDHFRILIPSAIRLRPNRSVRDRP